MNTNAEIAQRSYRQGLPARWPVLAPLALLGVALILRISDIYVRRLDELLGEIILSKSLGFALVVGYIRWSNVSFGWLRFSGISFARQPTCRNRCSDRLYHVEVLNPKAVGSPMPVIMATRPFLSGSSGWVRRSA